MPSSASSPRTIPIATSGTALIHIDFLLTGIVMTFLGPMLPILSVRWALTDARSGSLIFAQFFSSMFGMLLSGVLVERLGYRLTLILGLALMASGMALLAFGPWLLGLFAICVLGVGHGLTTPAGNLRTAEINPQGSAAALNVINAVWGIGAMSSPFLVALAQRVHSIPLFLYGTAAALTVLLLALASTRFVPDTHAHVALSSGPASSSLWNNRILPVICVLFFVYVGTETSFGGWVATYARRMEPTQHSFWNQQLATMTPSFFWGSLLVGRALAPLALKFARETTVAKAGLTLALLGGLALVSAHGMALVVAGSVLAGLGLASIFPISVSLLPGWFGDSARRASGPVFGSGNMGGATLPWVVGAVSTHYGSLRVALFVPLLGVAAMLAFYITNSLSRDQTSQDSNQKGL
jgi:FHS family glucose/mannose:H+ symporter-like MFS transporter